MFGLGLGAGGSPHKHIIVGCIFSTPVQSGSHFSFLWTGPVVQLWVPSASTPSETGSFSGGSPRQTGFPARHQQQQGLQRRNGGLARVPRRRRTRRRSGEQQLSDTLSCFRHIIDERSPLSATHYTVFMNVYENTNLEESQMRNFPRVMPMGHASTASCSGTN